MRQKKSSRTFKVPAYYKTLSYFYFKSFNMKKQNADGFTPTFLSSWYHPSGGSGCFFNTFHLTLICNNLQGSKLINPKLATTEKKGTEFTEAHRPVFILFIYLLK
jgi:hypothetical protein